MGQGKGFASASQGKLEGGTSPSPTQKRLKAGSVGVFDLVLLSLRFVCYLDHDHSNEWSLIWPNGQEKLRSITHVKK
jgi:hypothetical protein